jgi:hypothetical protein
VGQLSEFLHRPLLVDPVSSLYSDSLLFFSAEKTTAIIMTAVESRYFLRINGHPPFLTEAPAALKCTNCAADIPMSSSTIAL